MSMYDRKTYERYKEQLEQEIKECISEANMYCTETEPKWVNSVRDALREKHRLELILKFIEDNKEELDKW